MQEKAFFMGFILFFAWVAATTLAIHLGARFRRIEGNSPWRAFFAAFTSGFALLLAISFASGNPMGKNPVLWLVLYAVIALPVIMSALRTTFMKAAVPWIFAVLCLGASLLTWHFFSGGIMGR